MKAERLLICTNMPAPYRHALFNRIAGSGVDLTVCFYRRLGKGRTWTVNLDEVHYRHRILSAAQHWTPAHLLPLVSAVWRHRRATVIVGGWGDPEGLWAIFWCSLFRVRWGLWLGLNAPSLASGLRGWVKRALLRRAQMVVCYHLRTAEILRPFIPADAPLHVGWNVGDVEHTAAFAARCDGLAVNRLLPRLAFVGVLNQRKGVDLLLRAIEEGKLPGGLDLVGHGPLMDRARRAEALAPAGLLRVHGFLEGEQLHRVLAGADALVLPTRHDVGAIVVSEALATGLEVLLADGDGGAPDFVLRLPQHVTVFPADSYEGMLEAVNEFMQRRRSGRAAIRHDFLADDPMGVYAGAFVSAGHKTT